jgi:hypothetical protein
MNLKFYKRQKFQSIQPSLTENILHQEKSLQSGFEIASQIIQVSMC